MLRGFWTRLCPSVVALPAGIPCSRRGGQAGGPCAGFAHQHKSCHWRLSTLLPQPGHKRLFGRLEARRRGLVVGCESSAADFPCHDLKLPRPGLRVEAPTQRRACLHVLIVSDEVKLCENVCGAVAYRCGAKKLSTLQPVGTQNSLRGRAATGSTSGPELMPARCAFKVVGAMCGRTALAHACALAIVLVLVKKS
eukprot:359062-Chlamydomonas_euryale.AAC.22